MGNNQSKVREKLAPKDSEQKKIRHPQNDEEAVVKKEDKIYSADEADFGNVAAKREKSDLRGS